MDNEIIDKNLKLIYESPRDYTEYVNFIEIKINPQKRILAEEMDSKGLIKLQGEFCYKTDFGKEVMDKGGWIEYLNIKNKEEENKIKKDNERQKLKDEIDQLNLESLKHKQTIREQEDRIRDLSEELTKVNLLKAYWWVIGIGFSIGGIIGGILAKLL